MLSTEPFSKLFLIPNTFKFLNGANSATWRRNGIYKSVRKLQIESTRHYDPRYCDECHIIRDKTWIKMYSTTLFLNKLTTMFGKPPLPLLILTITLFPIENYPRTPWNTTFITLWLFFRLKQNILNIMNTV